MRAERFSWPPPTIALASQTHSLTNLLAGPLIHRKGPLHSAPESRNLGFTAPHLQTHTWCARDWLRRLQTSLCSPGWQLRWSTSTPAAQPALFCQVTPSPAHCPVSSFCYVPHLRANVPTLSRPCLLTLTVQWGAATRRIWETTSLSWVPPASSPSRSSEVQLLRSTSERWQAPDTSDSSTTDYSERSCCIAPQLRESASLPRVLALTVYWEVPPCATSESASWLPPSFPTAMREAATPRSWEAAPPVPRVPPVSLHSLSWEELLPHHSPERHCVHSRASCLYSPLTALWEATATSERRGVSYLVVFTNTTIFPQSRGINSSHRNLLI